jgi:NAD(P)-dependent dehydrogenase (short-subunit alcohol dehydrogenase family)
MGKALRVAVITGAAQGIGKRIAEVLAERGYSLALSDLRAPLDTLRAVRERGAEAIEVLGDISEETVVAKFATQVRTRWGRADVLVNNAGISFIAPAETLSGAEYRRVLEVNLVAPFLLAKAFGTMMLAQRSGSIINVASVAGLVGVADRAAYNASKHGLIGLTRTLAAEWGGRGVRVNAVCPGWVKTEMDVADQAGGRLYRRGHHRPGAYGAIRFTRRYRQGDHLSGRSAGERLRQRTRTCCRRRLDRRWKLGIAAASPSLIHQRFSPFQPGGHSATR